MPRSRVRAILLKNDSIRLSQDPCTGVKVNSNRFGSLAKKDRVSLEMWATLFWNQSTSRDFSRCYSMSKGNEKK